MSLILYIDYEEAIPDYIYDGINNNSKFANKIYIITNHKQEVEKKIGNLNIEIPVIISEKADDSEFSLVKSKFSEVFEAFRNGFWFKTIERFYIMKNFIVENKLENVFHVENDVLIYTHLDWIYDNLVEDKSKIYTCRDSPVRTLASLMFIPNPDTMITLTRLMTYLLLNYGFMNDMQLLNQCETESFITNHNDKGIVDACCFGQCLGGIDPRNGKSEPGFVNETSTFKPTLKLFSKRKDGYYYDNCKLHTLHIHSKELWKYIL